MSDFCFCCAQSANLGWVRFSLSIWWRYGISRSCDKCVSLVLVTPRIFLFDIEQKNPRGHEYQTNSVLTYKQYSQNGSHGNTLPEVNCNKYLPSKFVPKIRHVILIGIRAEGTKLLSILKCNNYVLAIGLFRTFPSNKIFPLDGFIPSNLEKRGKIFC